MFFFFYPDLPKFFNLEWCEALSSDDDFCVRYCSQVTIDRICGQTNEARWDLPEIDIGLVRSLVATLGAAMPLASHASPIWSPVKGRRSPLFDQPIVVTGLHDRSYRIRANRIGICRGETELFLFSDTQTLTGFVAANPHEHVFFKSWVPWRCSPGPGEPETRSAPGLYRFPEPISSLGFPDPVGKLFEWVHAEQKIAGVDQALRRRMTVKAPSTAIVDQRLMPRQIHERMQERRGRLDNDRPGVTAALPQTATGNGNFGSDGGKSARLTPADFRSVSADDVQSALERFPSLGTFLTAAQTVRRGTVPDSERQHAISLVRAFMTIARAVEEQAASSIRADLVSNLRRARNAIDLALGICGETLMLDKIKISDKRAVSSSEIAPSIHPSPIDLAQSDTTTDIAARVGSIPTLSTAPAIMSDPAEVKRNEE